MRRKTRTKRSEKACIDSLPLRRIGVSTPRSLPSLFELLPLPLPSRRILYLALRTYSVFPSPRPIYLPPRVAEWILFVSHRYFARPRLCRSPSKTVSPPRFMFPPTQRRIDPFLLSDVYVCGGALSSCFLSACSRARESASTRLTIPPLVTQSTASLFPSGSFPVSFETSFQRFCHPLSSTAPACRTFLPLTALYRLVTSVSRAGDLRASAPRTGD